MSCIAENHKSVENHAVKSYSDPCCKVRVDNNLSSEFKVKTAVRQGCILSPILFSIVIYYVEQGIEGAGIQTENGTLLIDLEFADDIVLFNKKEESLQKISNEELKKSSGEDCVMLVKLKARRESYRGISRGCTRSDTLRNLHNVQRKGKGKEEGRGKPGKELLKNNSELQMSHGMKDGKWRMIEKSSGS
eukprot:gene7610-13420_t